MQRFKNEFTKIPSMQAISLFAKTLDIMSLEQKTKITLKQIKEVLKIIETNS